VVLMGRCLVEVAVWMEGVHVLRLRSGGDLR
jgi:hypothetical protein